MSLTIDRKVHIYQFLILSALIAFAAISIVPVMDYTDRRMDEIKSDLIQSLEDFIGYNLEYSSISPSIFSFISINDLVIYRDVDSKEALARIKSLKAFYSPFYFFSRENTLTPLQAVNKFNISNANFSIISDEDQRLLSLFTGTGSSEITLLPLSTDISGRGVDVVFTSEVGTFRGENLFFSLNPDEDGYRTKLNGDLKVKLSDSSLPVEWAQADFEAKGSISEFFESLNFTVSTEKIESDFADLTDQAFQVISTSGQLEIRKVQDNSPIDLVMKYDRKREDLFISFNAEDFSPANLISLKSDYAEYNIYGTSEISGTGSLLYHIPDKQTLYSLNSRIELNRDIFSRPVVVKTDLTGNSDQINVRNLDLWTREGRLLFHGDIETDNFFPRGKITLRNITVPGGILLNSVMNVSHESGFISLSSDKVDLGPGNLQDVNFIIFPDGKDVTASLRAVLPGKDDHSGGEINIDSIIAFGDVPVVNTFVSLDSLPVNSLLSFILEKTGDFTIPEPFIATSLSTNLAIETNLKDLNVQVSRFTVQSDSDAENRLSFSGSYRPSGFKINDLFFNWDDYDLNGYLNASIDNDEFLVSSHFDLEDKPYRIEMKYSEGRLLFEGDYGIYAFVQKGDDESFDFRLNSLELPIPVQDITFLADLDLSGNYYKGRWNLFSDKSRVQTASLYTLINPELEVTARLDNEGADIYEVLFKDDVSSLKGLGRVTYLPGELTSWLSMLDESGKTNEQYDLFLSSEKGYWDSRLSVVSAPLERLVDSGLNGAVSFDAGLNGYLDDPVFQAVINTEKMNLNGVPVQFSSIVTGDRDQIRISDLEVEYNQLMLNRGLLMLNLEEGKLIATGAVNQNVNRSKASTSISAIINISESLDIFSLSSLIENPMTGKLTTAPITWDGMKTFPRLQVDLKKEGSRISGSIDNGKVLSAIYDFANGDVSLAIRDLFPFRLNAAGSLIDDVVDIAVSDVRFDPSFINYFMPEDPYKKKRSVIFTGGSVTGDFTIAGAFTDPDFNGALYVTNLKTESPFLAEIPDEVSFTAQLDGHSMVLDPFSIGLADGEIFVDSSFEFDEGLPTTYLVDVDIRGGAGARVAYEIPGFSWDGHFTGPVHIEGSRSGGFLKGNLISNDLESSLRSDAEPNKNPVKRKNPSVNGFTVDLTVETGRDVNFYLPNKQVPIIEATAEKGDSILISYDSRADELALTGRVDVRTGEINYFNKTFYLQEGFIEFNESQVSFNPRLNVRADVLAKDELGEDVTISLLFDDYLKNEFKPEFLSFPRKTENEILALLGQSFIPSSNPDQVSVASVLVATGGMIGKSTIMKPFEEAIKQTLDLDFVSFNTNLIENAILDRLQDQNIYDNDNGQMNFARYLEDTSLFVGEYIGDYLFLEGSLVVDYDESRSVTSTFGGLELNVNLNLQFITPFVLIDWSYDPNHNPDSEYFLPQNTISFTWQYSY